MSQRGRNQRQSPARHMPDSDNVNNELSSVAEINVRASDGCPRRVTTTRPSPCCFTSSSNLHGWSVSDEKNTETTNSNQNLQLFNAVSIKCNTCTFLPAMFECFYVVHDESFIDYNAKPTAAVPTSTRVIRRSVESNVWKKTVESIFISCLTVFAIVCDFLRHWRRRETPESVAIRQDDFDHES